MVYHSSQKAHPISPTTGLQERTNSQSSMTKAGDDESDAGKKEPSEESQPTTPESTESLSSIESTIATSSSVQQLFRIQQLIAMMHSLARYSAMLYNDIRQEVLATATRVHEDEQEAEDGPQEVTPTGPEEGARNRRLLTMQLNLARLFNPQILTEGVWSSLVEEEKEPLFQDSMVSLLLSLCNAIQYLLIGGGRLLSALSPLLDRIAAEPTNEQVWVELTLYQQSLVDFVRQVLHPRLIQALTALNDDDGDDDDDAQDAVVQEEHSKQREKDGTPEK